MNISWRDFFGQVRFYLSDTKEPFLWSDVDIFKAFLEVFMDLRNFFIDFRSIIQFDFFEKLNYYKGFLEDISTINELLNDVCEIPDEYFNLFLNGILARLYLKDDTEVFVERHNFFLNVYETGKVRLRNQLLKLFSKPNVSIFKRGLF